MAPEEHLGVADSKLGMRAARLPRSPALLQTRDARSFGESH